MLEAWTPPLRQTAAAAAQSTVEIANKARSAFPIGSSPAMIAKRKRVDTEPRRAA